MIDPARGTPLPYVSCMRRKPVRGARAADEDA